MQEMKVNRQPLRPEFALDKIPLARFLRQSIRSATEPQGKLTFSGWLLVTGRFLPSTTHRLVRGGIQRAGPAHHRLNKGN